MTARRSRTFTIAGAAISGLGGLAIVHAEVAARVSLTVLGLLLAAGGLVMVIGAFVVRAADIARKIASSAPTPLRANSRTPVAIWIAATITEIRPQV